MYKLMEIKYLHMSSSPNCYNEKERLFYSITIVFWNVQNNNFGLKEKFHQRNSRFFLSQFNISFCAGVS